MSDRSRRFYDQQLDLATPREWTDLVPRAILADIARAHGGDRAAGKLTAPVNRVRKARLPGLSPGVRLRPPECFPQPARHFGGRLEGVAAGQTPSPPRGELQQFLAVVE